MIALFNAGLYAELEARAHLLLAQYPKSGFVWKLLGAALKEQGKDAVPAFQQAAELSPDSADAHNNLGLVLHELGRYAHALVSYRRALKLDPSHAEIHLNLGNTLLELEQLDKAAASYRQALKIQPGLAEAHCGLGAVYRGLGLQDKATASYQQALKIQPGLVEAQCGLGTVQRDLGRTEEAITSYRRALEIRPDFMEGRLELARTGKVRDGDKNLEALIACEKSARDLPLRDRVFLHFALGKCYDDTGEYEKAFRHFAEGCRLKRSSFEYEPAKNTQLIDSIMHDFDAATLDRLRGNGDPSRLPIFILGMPRSGTTLIEQVIASHPEVHGGGELPYLMQVTESRSEHDIRKLNGKHLSSMGAEYLAKLQRHTPDKARVTDKMPANFLATGFIHLMLPNARIIHVGRNPVDTCLSCFTQLFGFKHEHTYDLAELGRYYADYFRLMQYWREVLPEGAFLDVSYEDMVSDQETQSRRIIEYCGLEWNDACLDFHENRRSVQTASVTQVRQPIYTSSMERWRHYEQFLGPLFDTLGDLAPVHSGT